VFVIVFTYEVRYRFQIFWLRNIVMSLASEIL